MALVPVPMGESGLIEDAIEVRFFVWLGWLVYSWSWGTAMVACYAPPATSTHPVFHSACTWLV